MQTEKRAIDLDMRRWRGEWLAIEKELSGLRRYEDEEETV